MKRLIPDTLTARTLAVLIIGLALSHIISVAMYATDRSNILLSVDGGHIADRITTIDRLIRRSPIKDQQRLVNLANEDHFKVSLTDKSIISKAKIDNKYSDSVQDNLISHFGNNSNLQLRLHVDETSPVKILKVSVLQPDQRWLNFVVPLQSSNQFWSFRFIFSMLVMLISVVIFSAIVVNQVTKPLAEFAHAAQRLGVDVNAPPLPEHGPREIRRVAQAFNQMQNRIRRFVKDRTQMIAAISHDLGTPIARMRLRAEFVEDDEQQKKMISDLDEMEKMVSSALSFARDDVIREPLKTVDFRTLIQRVCDDLGDTGFNIYLDVNNEVMPYDCHPAVLRRAFANLIENAARYGQVAHVSAIRKEKSIEILIDDEGPGIPLDQQEDVFKPFYRLETSRNRETGGTGLGMTVARTIIRAHGGDIVLSNRQEHGLRVKIHLPVVSAMNTNIKTGN